MSDFESRKSTTSETSSDFATAQDVTPAEITSLEDISKGGIDLFLVA